MIRTGVVVEVGDGVARVRPDSSPNVISGWLTVPRHAAGVKVGDPVSFAFDTKGGGVLGVLDGAGAGGGVTLQQVQQLIAQARVDTLMAENPVGHLRMETMNVNPATFLGFGTWVAWGVGRVPVSVAASGTFNTVEKTGGAETHTVTTAEMPSHRHGFVHSGSDVIPGTYFQMGRGAGNYPNPAYMGLSREIHPYTEVTILPEYVGGGSAHNNLQPYITCYMWKRAA